jgi:hypothetical protein
MAQRNEVIIEEVIRRKRNKINIPTRKLELLDVTDPVRLMKMIKDTIDRNQDLQNKKTTPKKKSDTDLNPAPQQSLWNPKTAIKKNRGEHGEL